MRSFIEISLDNIRSNYSAIIIVPSFDAFDE